MIKSTLNSFNENISQKLKNPFLGTFLIVWTIRNWKFIYSLFYFDSETKLDGRIEKIKAYFSEYGITEILVTVGYTFLLLIITYILLNFSRLIINFFEKIVTPKIYKITDKSSVVLKEDYDELKTEINRLESKVQAERDLRFKIQNENDLLEDRVKELLNPDIKEKSNNQNQKKQPGKKTKADILFERLVKNKQIKEFDNLAGDILNKRSIDSRADYVSNFTKLGLITQGVYMSGPSFYRYELTTDGKNIHDKILTNSD